MSVPADEWRRDLEAWAIPAWILSLALENPWTHPPVLFDAPAVVGPSPSHDRAREVLPEGGTLLDVGCGGGTAAFAVTPPAAHVIGVDHRADMLEMFVANARSRGVEVETHQGLWPAVGGGVPLADVVTAHHVVYNVADIVPFLEALSAHATRRVVLEMPQRHPLSPLNDAWNRFWQLERPTTPTSEDLAAVLREMGVTPNLEPWEGTLRGESAPELAAHLTRIRLCLPASSEDEVRRFLTERPPSTTRALTTIWWDI